MYTAIYIYTSTIKKEDTRGERCSCWVMWGISSLIKMQWNRQEGWERAERQVSLCRKRRELNYERSVGGHQITGEGAGSVQECKENNCMVCV